MRLDLSRYNHIAILTGARTIYVNLEPLDPPNPAFQETYLGKAEELLSELLAVTPR